MIENSAPIIDTHQHLWDLDRVQLAWLDMEGKPDAVGFDRSFLLPEYLDATRGSNVTASVYMEVNVIGEDQEKEVEYILELCGQRGNPVQAAVIGGFPDDPTFSDYVSRYAADDRVKGVRTVLHDSDRPRGRCLTDEFVRGCNLLGDLGLSFDLCMRPAELIEAARLVKACPETRFVLDHCGNMPVVGAAPGLRRLWEEGIRELARCDNVDCKISGIVAGAGPAWQPSDLSPIINFCLDSFGEDRVCFGGDWPVCTLTASYGDWLNALKWIVRNRPPEFKRKLFHDNALRIYQLQT